MLKLDESLFGAKKLAGKLYGRVVIDSQSENYLKGAMTIKDGYIDKTAVLLALSDYMKFPKIQTINFDNFHLNFLMLKDRPVNCNLKIYNPELILATKLRVDNNIKGELLIRIYEGLLRESYQFNRLLKYITPQSPYIDFRFQIGGLLDSPRFIWMKDKFKEAIEKVLPQASKESLEEGLNIMMDELFHK